MKPFIKILAIALCLTSTYVHAQSEATLYTSMGNLTINLTDTLTPITVDSFIARVTGKFYDGLIFHRVIDGFMIQGGDPAGDGSGGPGYTIPDEFHPSLKNVSKSLAMANSGPNTGGCQFYINLVNNSHLNNKHTVFGMVTSGFSVVQTIGKVATDTNDRPLTDVVIDSIRITKFPTSITAVARQMDISVYPNPGIGIFNITLPSILTKMDIINMNGQIVFSSEAKNRLQVDIREQSTGLYIMRFTNKTGTGTCRLVLQ